MAKLIFNQPFMKAEYKINQETSIGRGKENDMTIPDYELFAALPKESQRELYQKLTHVSRKHAKMVLTGARFFVIDVGTNNTGSTYGTFVNREKLVPQQPCALKDNDRIKFGSVECTFKEE